MAAINNSICNQQYEFWSKLIKSDQSLYLLKAKHAHHYYISKKLTPKPYQIRLDVYFNSRYHKKNSYQSLTICNVPNGGLTQQILDGISKLFNNGYESGKYYGPTDKYRNCYVITNDNPKCYHDSMLDEQFMIDWFNNHIAKLIGLL